MQEETLYRHILRDSWKLAWRNPKLWVLGGLSVFWGSIGAYSSLDTLVARLQPALPAKLAGGALPAWQDFTSGGMMALVIFALVVLALAVVFAVLITSARGGLIFALARRGEGKSVLLSEAFKKGAQAFWPVLGIGLLSRLDLAIAYLLLNPLAQAESSLGTLILYIVAFVVTTVMSLVFSLLAMYAIAYVMLEGMSFGQAVQKALTLFARHWLVSLELALLLYGLNLLAGLAALAAILALGIPFVLLGILLAFLQAPGGLMLALIPLMAVYVIFLILAGSIFVTFQYSAWTLLYLRACEGQAVPKLMRVTARYARLLHRRLV